ncbi:hypothetical protein ACLOJK_026776 [Asimina triloba]
MDANRDGCVANGSVDVMELDGGRRTLDSSAAGGWLSSWMVDGLRRRHCYLVGVMQMGGAPAGSSWTETPRRRAEGAWRMAAAVC